MNLNDENVEMKRKYARVDDVLRSRMIKNHNEGCSPVEIANKYDVSRKTVSSIVLVYAKTGRINKKTIREPRLKKLDQADVSFVQSKIDDRPDLTLNELKVMLISERNISVSRTTVASAIRNFSYTLKNMKDVPERRNTPKTIEDRYAYALHFTNIDQNKLIYVDETGFSLAVRRKKGRSVKGSTPVRTVRQIRSKNISVCSALTAQSLLKFEIHEGSYNTVRFNAFIAMIVKNLSENNLVSMIFVMDNCSIHKSKALKETLESNGHELLFLPAYSPFLNPIEEVFSQWKSHVRGCNANSEEDLKKAINEGFQNVTSGQALNYFCHMRSYLRKCLEKEVINY